MSIPATSPTPTCSEWSSSAGWGNLARSTFSRLDTEGHSPSCWPVDVANSTVNSTTRGAKDGGPKEIPKIIRNTNRHTKWKKRNGYSGSPPEPTRDYTTPPGHEEGRLMLPLPVMCLTSKLRPWRNQVPCMRCWRFTAPKRQSLTVNNCACYCLKTLKPHRKDSQLTGLISRPQNKYRILILDRNIPGHKARSQHQQTAGPNHQITPLLHSCGARWHSTTASSTFSSHRLKWTSSCF